MECSSQLVEKVLFHLNLPHPLPPSCGVLFGYIGGL